MATFRLSSCQHISSFRVVQRPKIRPSAINQRIVSFIDKAEIVTRIETFYQSVNGPSPLLADTLPTLLSPNCIFSDRVWSDRDITPIQKVFQHYEKQHQHYPDLRYHLDSVLSSDDSRMAAAHWTAMGSCNPTRDSACTDKRSIYSGVTLFNFRDDDGLIDEIIIYRQPSEEERSLLLRCEFGIDE